jgi:GNAT superfamily N-acetyltransferase
MDFTFHRVYFNDLRDEMGAHLVSLPGRIDAFVEEYIVWSNHYRIQRGDEFAGFASISDGSLITQFAVAEPFRRYGQDLFRSVRSLEAVTSAFVPTCDEFLLAHALDDYQRLDKQAYLFRTPDGPPAPALSGQCSLRLATYQDAARIRQDSGDFFSLLHKRIPAGEIYVTERDEQPVGYGLLIRSALYPAVGSVGMFTIEEHRQTGVGTATIAMLIEECRRQGLEPVAGCWFDNHASKRTLERAGMHTPTRLLKFTF